MAESRGSMIAIVGGESLMARELKELLPAISPLLDLRFIAGEVGATKLARDEEGNAMVLSALTEDNLAGMDAIILAGSADASLKAMELAGPKGPPIIDLTGTLEEQPRARLRAPGLEGDEERPMDTIDVVAHPAAIALATLLRRIAVRFAVARCVCEVFEPASERGQRGLTELQQQTVNLLSFKPLPKEVFDAQSGFNLLAAYGEESPYNLEEIEARIDRHLATLLIPVRMPMPSLRLVQAPVFHGYSMSLWIEFESTVEVAQVEEAIACAQIDVRRAAEEPPNNVGAAGEAGLIAGGIRSDRNHPRALWMWLVTDNLRLVADAAVTIAKEYA